MEPEQYKQLCKDLEDSLLRHRDKEALLWYQRILGLENKLGGYDSVLKNHADKLLEASKLESDIRLLKELLGKLEKKADEVLKQVKIHSHEPLKKPPFRNPFRA